MAGFQPAQKLEHRPPKRKYRLASESIGARYYGRDVIRRPIR
jgi:hypothetical protein